jgi:FixJ family two-component response regulator
MNGDDYIVFIVVDDVRIREALGELPASHNIPSIAFGTAGEYVDADKQSLPAFLILYVEATDISGLLNKQAAVERRISEVTPQIHRRNLMQAASWLAGLLQIAEKRRIPVTHPRRAVE